MSTLSDYRHSIATTKLLRSIAKTVCPPSAVSLGLLDEIVEHVELSMRTTPTVLRQALEAGLKSYDLASIAWPGHWGKRAAALSDDKARSYFESWYHSKITLQHEFARGVKSLLCLACYEQPAMMTAIGYTPQEWIDKSVKKRLTTYGSAIAKREQEILADDPLPNVTTKAQRGQQ